MSPVDVPKLDVVYKELHDMGLTEAQAVAWMTAENKALGLLTPLEYADQFGVDMLLEYVWSMQSGFAL